MKKIKIFTITMLAFLLASCTKTTTPNNNQENQRLSNPINIPQNIDENNTTVRFPASEIISGDISGENRQENNIILDESPNTITETYEKEAENITNKKITAPNNSAKNLLASYSSKVYTKTEDRQKNLRIVCDKLSGIILNPNEEFSYNTTCRTF